MGWCSPQRKLRSSFFTGRTSFKVEGNLYINCSKLPFSEEVNYLGLTLNRELNWNSHVVSKINKYKGKLCALRSALGARWGPSPKMVLWAYESLIVPSLSHGAMVWGHSNFNKTTLDKLRQLNRLAACLTAPVRKTTPSAGLEVVLGLKPLELVIMESGLSDSFRWVPKIKWDGIGARGLRGHVWTWSQLRAKLGVRDSIFDRTGLRHFNWDPPCSLVSDFVIDNDTLVCAVFTKYLDNSMRFTSLLEGCGLVGQVPQPCIISGQDLYCLYRGFETIIGALGHLVGRGEKVVILSKRRPFSLQQPLIKNLKSRALLSAMNNLAVKTGHKILLSNNKTMLERYWAVILGGVGRDWSQVHTFSALLSKQSLKRLVRQWGNDRWQANWAGLSICQQTKVWFPFVTGNFILQNVILWSQRNVCFFVLGFKGRNLYQIVLLKFIFKERLNNQVKGLEYLIEWFHNCHLCPSWTTIKQEVTFSEQFSGGIPIEDATMLSLSYQTKSIGPCRCFRKLGSQSIVRCVNQSQE